MNAHEHRVHRAAARHGLLLVKSHTRTPQALDYGTYGLVDGNTRGLVAGSHQTGYGLSLDDVEQELHARR